MLRFVFSILFLTQAFAPTLAIGCEAAPSYVETREAIYAHDLDRVEQILSEAQDLFEAGQRSADDLRCLFGHFEKMRPATFDFVEDWRAAYPASAFAQTAQAFSLNAVGRSVARAMRATFTPQHCVILPSFRAKRGAWQRPLMRRGPG